MHMSSSYQLPAKSCKLALTADWLVVFGGAEHALLEMHRIWPSAPIFTTMARKACLGPLQGADIRVTRLQRWYKMFGKHQPLLPWMPRALEELDLQGFDVILSSSHAVGKGIVPPSTAVHVCYCHTPMRYAWQMEEEYLRDFHIPRVLRGFARRRLKILRRWDLATAKRVDVFIANSSETQRRIRDIYGRDSMVIPPPVDDRFLATPLSSSPRRGFLAIGRLVPYKRFDLLIEAANTLGFPLSIAGTGRELARLQKMAGPTVRFLGFVPEEDLHSLYAKAEALLFPQEEDAGIVPLEAQACGTPVIAYGAGGVRDTVIDGTTGIFFPEQSVRSITAALERFQGITFHASAIREHASQFAASRFRERLREVVEKYLR